MERHRISFRLFLRSMSRRGTEEQQQLAKAALADRNILDACADDCCQNFDSTASGVYGDWQSFLEWLFDHADEIFALIARLIALFSDEVGQPV